MLFSTLSLRSLASRFYGRQSLAYLLAVAFSVGGVQAQTSLEMQELNTALQVAAQKIQALEQQVASAKDKNEALIQSTAAANQEAAELKDRYERLRGLLEGLGISALENNREQTQDRLLSALSDLRLAETSRRDLAKHMMELTEASLAFAKTIQSPDPIAADGLQKALINAENSLAANARKTSDEDIQAANTQPDLQNVRIVSLKADLGIAVLSVGSRDGIKPGMPFEIYREDKPIAKIRVTEVRHSVCGAVVQELASVTNPVRVGDQAKVDITQPF
jgi:hypothetical protein